MPQYRGANIVVPENDAPHLEYLQQVAKHQTLVLQRCTQCGHLRYPPGTACQKCQSLDLDWVPSIGKGTIYSYAIVPHAISPLFRDWVPYPIAAVELDEKLSTAGWAVRVIANIIRPDGRPEDEANIAIGKRVRVTTIDIGDGMAIPQYMLADEPPAQTPWQFAAKP